VPSLFAPLKAEQSGVSWIGVVVAFAAGSDVRMPKAVNRTVRHRAVAVRRVPKVVRIVSPLVFR